MISDVVIVGAGASGAVLARRLADDPEITVTLVEAGPSDERRTDILRLRDWFSLLSNDEVSVPYPIEPQPQANSALVHSRGRMLGGSSSHNAGIALRAPDSDLARWAATAGPGWGPDATAAAWGRVLSTVGVSPPTTRNPLASAVVKAGEQAGLRPITSWGREVPDGIGWLPLNVRDGMRRSSSAAYLHPVDGLPPNLTVLTETPVERVQLDDHGAAVAVLTTRGSIEARHEIVLCAGAFETPKLLMLSGVGPREELVRHRLPVRLELAGVGDHLVDHPEAIATWATSCPVPDEGDQFWEVAIFAQTERGLTMAHVGTRPAVPAGYPEPPHGLSILPNAAHPKSEGTVRLRSADPADLPLVDPRYLTDPGGDDLGVLVAGIELARRIVAAPALGGWLGEEVAPGTSVSTTAEIEHYVRATLATVHHPAGTARMGDPTLVDGVVVDSELRVLGLRGLRIADASVFPSLPSVNPCLTCMMIGERAAEIVRAAVRETRAAVPAPG